MFPVLRRLADTGDIHNQIRWNHELSALVPFPGRVFLRFHFKHWRVVCMSNQQGNPIEIRLQGGAVRSYEAGISIGEVASSISTSLGKQAIGGIVDGVNVDLDMRLEQDCELVIVTLDSEEGLYRYRHSTAHVLAQALKRIYGAEQVKLGIGPVTQDGFYYDVDLEHALSISDLAAIEREMNKIVQENVKISRRVVSREEALRLFEEIQDPYKLELIRDLPQDAELSIYDQGEFLICAVATSSVHWPDQSLQAAECGRGLLAGRFEQQNAAAYLRHCLSEQSPAGRPPAHAGGSQEAGSSQARQRAGAVHVLGGSARDALLSPERHDDPYRAGAILTRAAAAGRVSGGSNSADDEQSSVGAIRSLGAL